MSRFSPNPAIEDATWYEVRCTCNTLYSMVSPDGRYLRMLCQDRVCRVPGKRVYVYWQLDAGEPRLISHVTHDPVTGVTVEDSYHG